MIRHLQTLINTAYSEWKIQIRQRTTWMLAGLFFLVGWYSINHASLPLTSAIAIARSTAQGLGLFGSLFVVILGATGFLREFQPDYDFLWTRSFSTIDYIVGKYLGVCVSVGMALLPVGLWVAYLMGTLHGFQSIPIQAKVWSTILAPTLVFLLAVTLLAGLLLRRSLWTSLVMVFVVGGVLALNLDVTQLMGFAPFGIYVSPLIGYGPDNLLVGLHRAFYLELSTLVMLIGLSLVRATSPRRERALARDRGVLWVFSIAGMLVLILYTAANFQDERNALSVDPPSNPFTGEPVSCSFLNSYRIDLVLRNESAQIDGRAFFLLRTNDTSLRIPIELNSGLQISGIEVTPPGTEVELVRDALVLNIPIEFIGQNVSLTLEYSGSIRVPRYFYDRMFRTIDLAFAPFRPGGYLGGKTAFLTRDGNWHPFPRCVPDSLKVELVGAPWHMVHTADSIETSPGRVTLIWEQQPPTPLLAASQNYQTIKMGASTLFTAPHQVPERELDTLFSPYPVLMSQIETHLQEGKPPDSRANRIAVVPLLKYDSYDPSSGVYLLPEDRGIASLLFKPESSQGVMYSPELLYQRWVAEQIIRSWWCSTSACPQLQGQVNDTVPYDASGLENQTVLNALLTYSALRLSEPLISQKFVTEEIEARQRMVKDRILWVELDLPFDHSPVINSMIVQLHRLWEQTGPEPFWQLVREYRRFYGTTSISEEEFGRFVEKITGENLP